MSDPRIISDAEMLVVSMSTMLPLPFNSVKHCLISSVDFSVLLKMKVTRKPPEPINNHTSALLQIGLYFFKSLFKNISHCSVGKCNIICNINTIIHIPIRFTAMMIGLLQGHQSLLKYTFCC